MEISLDKVNSRSDPYQLFIDSIRSPSTLRRYKNLLYTFLKLIPNQIYIDSLGKTPQDREAITLATFFVELARKDIDLASNVIAAFIKEDKKRVTSGEISSQTLPNHIKP
ncbi:MAG: site-specific integrase, partial [Nitrosarchaeum sp.]|nr:site-specific integrase [Nitrosarchaeum sp.]